jgi:hypothetical protein
MLVVVELTRGQKFRDEKLGQKYDLILINKVTRCGENSVVCDYGKRLIIFTFHESEDLSR